MGLNLYDPASIAGGPKSLHRARLRPPVKGDRHAVNHGIVFLFSKFPTKIDDIILSTNQRWDKKKWLVRPKSPLLQTRYNMGDDIILSWLINTGYGTLLCLIVGEGGIKWGGGKNF